MKYFMYCRKSSEEDSRQTQSLDTQRRILTEFARSNKLHVVDIITESKSAKEDGNRPLFTNMLKRITAREADCILAVHTDRLARNFIEAGQIIKLIETKQLKEVRTPQTTYNSVPSLLYMGFDFVFAAHYSRDLSEKVRAGNQSKLLAGEYPTYAPLGYLNVPPGRGIIPDPLRAPAIQRAFELYSTGEHSVQSLAKVLRDEGLRSRLGKVLVPSTVHRILTNPEYYGVIRRKGTLYAGKHEPLITQVLFETVQAIIENRSRPRKQIHAFTYRDFLICDQCGCKMTAGISKGKYIYYRCTNGKRTCDQHKRYWSEQHIKEQLAQFFDMFTLDKEKAEVSFQLYKDSFLSASERKAQTESALNTQLQRLDRQLGRLEDLYLAERITNERYDARKKDIDTEVAQITTLLAHPTEQSDETTLELVETIKNQAVKLSTIFEEGDDEVRRDLVQSVLWNCGFMDGKITSTRLTELWKPLENLNLTADLEKWRCFLSEVRTFFEQTPQ